MSITPTTWNPIDKSASVTLSGGNLVATCTGSSHAVRSIFSASSGKYYWECTITNLVGYSNTGIGIANSSYDLDTFLGLLTNAWGRWQSTTRHDGASISYPTFHTGDIISVAFDLDNGKIWWAHNGTWHDSGDPAAGTNAGYTGVTGTLYATCCLQDEESEPIIQTTNFGASAFSHSVPSGFESGFGEELIINESSITFSVKQTNHYNPFPILGGV